jgi:hypothetical protein
LKSEELAHVLRAAADVLGESDFIVIGSAAILGSYPDEALPHMATRSDEADLIPFVDPDGLKADLVEGAIGEGSPFHTLFGYYAQGVSEDTAKLPTGWRERLVPFDPPDATPGCGFCLEPHDLAASKLVAGRPKDFEFVGAIIEHGLIDVELLIKRVESVSRVDAPPIRIERAVGWVRNRSDEAAP